MQQAAGQAAVEAVAYIAGGVKVGDDMAAVPNMGGWGLIVKVLPLKLPDGNFRGKTFVDLLQGLRNASHLFR